jgi:hypothetical protein
MHNKRLDPHHKLPQYSNPVEMQYLVQILNFFQHLVVFCNGNLYQLKVSDSYGSPITLLDLEGQLEWIKHDAHHSDSE